MRRLLLIALTTLFHLSAGIWIGATIGVGALTAPQAFRELGEATAGTLMGHVFQRLNVLSMAMLAVMLAVALFETWYRRRTVDRFWLVARLTLTAAGLIVVAFLNARLMPRMLQVRSDAQLDTFQALHETYRGWSQAGIWLGVGAMAATVVINVGARRSGSHRRTG